MTTTTTREIGRDGWPQFFDDFSRGHEGRQTVVEVLGGEIGAQVAGRSLRFEGVTAEMDDECSITVMLGDTPEAHLTHTIVDPSRVCIERSELAKGTVETLEIESADGLTTLVRFESLEA